MKINNHVTMENKEKLNKVFKPLSNQQLESVVGGPETSRGTESVVQKGD
ncbi:bacteriocin [Flavobacterium artemisiae]|uniref:Bacteriocin n=1 Tax=Flavobacterium artemisiae TaxID=2126556 RepID=A0ABW4H8T6_9FLAO